MARWNSANKSRYYHLLNKIADAGHNVLVVQPPPRSSEETNYIDLPPESHANVELYTVAIASWLWDVRFPLDKFFKKALYTILSYFTIRRLIKKNKPDILIVYNLPQYIYTIGNNIPIVFDYADDYIAMLQHELGLSNDNLFCIISSLLLRRLINKSVLVTSVSETLNRKVVHQNKLLLSNGADFFPSNDASTTLHIDKKQPVLGYVGAFEYFIDLDMMLDAAERLPDYTFLFVGAGREFSRIKDMIFRRKLHNVILTGAVPHHQAMQFISEMDICLNLFNKGPVADAASPIKLFEYMSCAKPVIATRLAETQRLDAKIKSFYYADNIAELVAQVEYILRHPELTKENVEREVQMVKTNFTWFSLADKFIYELTRTLQERMVWKNG